MYLTRLVEEPLIAAAREFPVLALVGARQTGKSTTLRRLFLDTHQYVTFDDISNREAARRDPELFLSNFLGPTIFDEIQYAPELMPALKRRVDESPRPGHYLLTGSQQLHLVRGLRETLAGRVLLLQLHPLTAWERAGFGAQRHWLTRWVSEGARPLLAAEPSTDFSPLRELIRGGLPGLIGKSDRFLPGYFRSYITTYLERDLPAQHEVQDATAIGTFLRLLAPLTAQEINRSQLGREIGASSPTAARWLGWLAGANLWRELPAYDGNVLKRVAKKPKGMLFDTGLVCHLLQAQRPQTLQAHPSLGSVFEAAMALELQAVVDSQLDGATLHHWRTPYGHEVDLVLEHEGRLFAFECKWRSQVDPRALVGLTAFRQAYGGRVAGAAVLTPIGAARWLADGVFQLPWSPSRT